MLGSALEQVERAQEIRRVRLQHGEQGLDAGLAQQAQSAPAATLQAARDVGAGIPTPVS